MAKTEEVFEIVKVVEANPVRVSPSRRNLDCELRKRWEGVINVANQNVFKLVDTIFLIEELP